MFFILKRRHQSSENNRLQKQTGNWNKLKPLALAVSLQFEVQSASIIRINEVGSYATFSLVCSAFETGTGIRIGREGVLAPVIK